VTLKKTNKEAGIFLRYWRLKFGVALACCGLVSAALAGPDAPEAGTSPTGDAVMHLLAERGLVDPSTGKAGNGESSLLTQVRDRASDLVLDAMNFIGVRYRRGGQSAEQGFDCSGFTRYVFEHSVGLVLPRRAVEQAHAPGLLAISRDQLKPGDLVFFNTLRSTFSHVGIYIGDGKFIHSPRTGEEVRVEDMRVSYWMQRFSGARRAPQVGGDIPRPAP
jgi:cell wall-associated NlpC family hydrolase